MREPLGVEQIMLELELDAGKYSEKKVDIGKMLGIIELMLE